MEQVILGAAFLQAILMQYMTANVVQMTVAFNLKTTSSVQLLVSSILFSPKFLVDISIDSV